MTSMMEVKASTILINEKGLTFKNNTLVLYLYALAQVNR